MNSLLYPISAALATLALLFRLPALLRRPEPGLIGLCLTFAATAYTFILSTPAVWIRVNAFFEIKNFAGMLAQCGALAIAVAQQAVVLAWAYPWSEARRRILLRLALWVAAVGCMVPLFFMSISAMSNDPLHFAADAAGIPAYSLYLAVYLTCFMIGVSESARLCWRYSLSVSPGWLRRGLRTAAVGSALGFPYAAVRVADIFAARTGVDAHRFESIARLGAGLGGYLLVVGWTMPTWGPRLSRVFVWVRHQRSFYALSPLWRALYEIMPDIALTLPRQADRPARPVRHIDFHLYRRLIEIRDAAAALRPYHDEAISQVIRRRAAAQDITGRTLEAIVEAADLAAAIERRRLCISPPDLEVSTTEGHTEQHNRADEGLYGELSWLTMVAEAFVRSPLVVSAAEMARNSHVSTLSE
ncbi:hypothetical protein NDR87_11235 [Nocardia sp. CDC159]|uniref:DUF6545 domain-containing protein n=1 Tax=Nocardia pulmonis TaxID=2951408 RepID=A0A9X2E956_9NOCA|nr:MULTISPECIES: MAB_1171c family putative transporter [Nocardia]MCM6774046.1 hypothetical protein [Nocardia pulmonis]MCM6786933.1 hypothetical protein [Nocardia sp. CDC159]